MLQYVWWWLTWFENQRLWRRLRLTLTPLHGFLHLLFHLFLSFQKAFIWVEQAQKRTGVILHLKHPIIILFKMVSKRMDRHELYAIIYLTSWLIGHQVFKLLEKIIHLHVEQRCWGPSVKLVKVWELQFLFANVVLMVLVVLGHSFVILTYLRNDNLARFSWVFWVATDSLIISHF